MEEILRAMDDLHTTQLELLKRWRDTYTGLAQQNSLLTQQVDYLQQRIAELESMLLQERSSMQQLRQS